MLIINSYFTIINSFGNFDCKYESNKNPHRYSLRGFRAEDTEGSCLSRSLGQGSPCPDRQLIWRPRISALKASEQSFPGCNKRLCFFWSAGA